MNNPILASEIAALVADSLKDTLTAQNSALNTRIDNLTALFESFSSDVAESREESQRLFRLLGDMFQYSHKTHHLRLCTLEESLGVKVTLPPFTTGNYNDTAPKNSPSPHLHPQSSPDSSSVNRTLVAEESILSGSHLTSDSWQTNGTSHGSASSSSHAASTTSTSPPSTPVRASQSLGLFEKAVPPSPSTDSIDDDMVQEYMTRGTFPSSPISPSYDVYLSKPPSPPPSAMFHDLFDGQLSPLPSERPPESDTEDDVPLLKREPVDPALHPSRKRKREIRKQKASSASTSQQPTKRTKHATVKTEKIQPIWPKPTTEYLDHDGLFIQCYEDVLCGRWYHYCCVGIVPDDPRLEHNAKWLCPPCIAKGQQAWSIVFLLINHLAGLRPTPCTPGSSQSCSRPDCPVIGDYYEPTGIFGRYHKTDPTSGERRTSWLVFWKDYTWAHASWEPTAPGEDKRQHFMDRAKVEGLDLNKDLIMLEAAIHGGAKKPWETPLFD
ncbi:Chromo domain-containing protein [Mycena indigotica]|uniref:Chromo domain-containing protein n=1 Tax=Mycena indigotica TaxID=2126181 RepID=A0A8H6TF80_9AGAR|nr:Chromo domain-containing protein [Mycena indigotica]KAF7316425.1 Chromo domain-containing protein [Mycena indigotica]